MIDFFDPIDEQDVKRYIGHPVCAVMNNGQYYIGYLQEIKHGKIFLDGMQGKKKLSRDPDQAKAQIQAFGLGGLANGLLGGHFNHPVFGGSFPSGGQPGFGKNAIGGIPGLGKGMFGGFPGKGLPGGFGLPGIGRGGFGNMLGFGLKALSLLSVFGRGFFI